MRKKAPLIFMLLLCVTIIAGCASWKKAVSETTPEETAAMQAKISAVTAVVPAPYNIPVNATTGALAFLLVAVGHMVSDAAQNWWKKKTGGTTPPSA